MEDDFLPCPFALSTMASVLANLGQCRPNGDWTTLSFSEGMNAIAVSHHVLPKLVEMMADKIEWKPPDLMIYYDWLQGHTHLQYKHYLFTHVGDTSSFAFRNVNVWQKLKGRERFVVTPARAPPCPPAATAVPPLRLSRPAAITLPAAATPRVQPVPTV